jgi:hypothetical protein
VAVIDKAWVIRRSAKQALLARSGMTNAFIGAALNRCVALLPTAHQVGPGGPIPDNPAAGLENLSEATNCVPPSA